MSQRIFTDQLHNRVTVSYPPQRVVSLVPSQTELLADLGLESRVVGITKFCIHPAHWRNSKTLVGGTKNVNIERIRSLNPDLILGNKEENSREGIAALAEEFPVWMSNVVTPADARLMIREVGAITDTANRANELVQKFDDSLKYIRRFDGAKVLYLIWKKPWMAAGNKTFINAMLALAGFINVIQEDRYPELTDAQISQLNPDFIFLSSEPYPFTEKHKALFNETAPASRVVLVDGKAFSWYGSRLLRFSDYLNHLIIQLH